MSLATLAPTGVATPTSTLSASLLRVPDWESVHPFDDVRDAINEFAMPHARLDDEVNAWRRSNSMNVWRRARKVISAKSHRIPTFFGVLWVRRVSADGSVLDFGLASMGVVTTTGVNFIVDAFQNLTEVENLKFHGLGTGTNAEAAGDTALQTELTTQYNPDNTRATGSLTEGASANVFRTAGTNTVDAAAAVTEHGILSQAATGGGTLLDRSVFSVINLAGGDALTTTYDLTLPSGG